MVDGRGSNGSLSALTFLAGTPGLVFLDNRGRDFVYGLAFKLQEAQQRLAACLIAPGRIAHMIEVRIRDSLGLGASLSGRFHAINFRAMKTGFIATFIAALLIRLSFLGIWMHFSHGSWNGGSFEGGEMGSIAVNLFEGRGFSSPFFPGSAPTAWLCPVVPFLWSIVMRLQGEATLATAKLLIFLQAIPSALAVSLYWLIAKEIRLKHMELSAHFPTAIAAVLALWPESLFRVGELWYFVWEECAVAALVLVGIKWLQRRTWSTAVWLGLIGGTLALINIAPVPFLVSVIVLPALSVKCDKREFVKTALLACVIMLAIISPWLVRCRVRLGGFVPLRSNAGTELLQGNNAIDCIRQTDESLHPTNSRYEMQRFNALGELQYNRIAFREALNYIRAHKVQTAIRIMKRIYVAWFTDILDLWPNYKNQKWWNGGPFQFFSTLTTIVTALSTLSLTIFAIASGRLEALPFRWLLFTLLLLMPMLHYFTVMEDSYTYVDRIWLAIIGAFAIFNSPRSALRLFRAQVL